uniref:5'-nucleotidase n=1 Tax=Chaetoceros debilis TaxID=122233 RepID=A0A7S3V633_9STRA|mmetsp:Transcript_23726/g.36076  ORF Transcript_23726/g.36076 Transcript_23726/m.36076 type:complete len:607 (+) Transcript_23726:176-1996(+)
MRLIIIIACLATADAFVLSARTPLIIATKRTTSPHNTPLIILASTQDSHAHDEEWDTEAQMQMAKFSTLPRHESSDEVEVNQVLIKMEKAIQDLYMASANSSSSCKHTHEDWKVDNSYSLGSDSEKVFANTYVDLGKVDTVGFDYDYTLVTYTDELLDLIYDMALKRLVKDFIYPDEMLTSNMKFDPQFSVRGLAVDRENGWICHLSYTHSVAVAYEGRQKVSRERLMKEYSGKRALKPTERKKRLKPLNDLFSMAECCLIADVVQFFHDSNIPFCPKNAVVDILKAIGATHISGDFHRLVAENPEQYFEPRPYLKEVLQSLKDSGKRLLFVSNSPFWYVDAGMNYVIGEKWKDMWDACIVSAGKPRFYTESTRPFREVSQSTGRIKFKQVKTIEPGEVYSEGCLKELTKCLDWFSVPSSRKDEDEDELFTQGGSPVNPTVLYIGDSLFADLVDAKRDFGWTTAAVTPEVGWEFELAEKVQFDNAQTVIDLLLESLRTIQDKLGPGVRTEADIEVIDKLERLVSLWREEQNTLLGNPFGSVFRAKYQPSLFAHSLRRYCDLYMPNISALRHYSPQHRFYPQDARLLSHELQRGNLAEFDDIMERYE